MVGDQSSSEEAVSEFSEDVGIEAEFPVLELSLFGFLI